MGLLQQISEVLGIGYMFPLVVITIGLMMSYWYSVNRRFVKYGNKLPGPATLPIIGNAHYVIGKNHNGMYLQIE